VFLWRFRQGRQRPWHEIIFGDERYDDTSMFDTIVLLTEAVEQPVFASVLRGHNPRLTVLPVSTSDDLAAVAITVLLRTRLIAFTTSVIVPQKALDQLKVPAAKGSLQRSTCASSSCAPCCRARRRLRILFGSAMTDLVKVARHPADRETAAYRALRFCAA
jgi:hypothetical protein